MEEIATEKEKFTAAKAKKILWQELSDYANKYNEKEDVLEKLDVCEDIVRILKMGINETYKNLSGIHELLKIIYGDKRADNLYQNIYEIIYISTHAKDEEIMEMAREKGIKVLSILEDTIETLKIELAGLNAYLTENEHNNKIKRYMLYNIKNDGYISNANMVLFDSIMKKYGISSTEIIEVVEKINANYRIKKGDNKGNVKKSSILGMLNFEPMYESVTEIEEYNFGNTQKSLINSICETLRKENFDYVIEYLPRAKQDNIELEEFDYIYKKIINSVLESISTIVECIKDIEIYAESRSSLAYEFNGKLNQLRMLKKFYMAEREVYLEKEKQNSNEEEFVNQLLFMKGDSRVYFESDLKDIPNEMYSELYDLLYKLKTNTLKFKESKGFESNDKLKKFRELKGDQGRIMYKHLCDNIYAIVGAFQKKDDNASKKLMAMAARYNKTSYATEEMIKEKLKESQEIEEDIMAALMQNSRKSNRY